MENTVMISMQIDEFQALMANCFNSCLKYHKPIVTPLIEEEKFIDSNEGSKVTSTSMPTFRRNVKNREFPCYKKGGKLLFLRSELVAWVKSGKRKTIIEIDQEIADSDKKKKGARS